MQSPPADQGSVPCSSKIPVAQVDGREEILCHYSRGDSVVLLNRSSDGSSGVPKVCSGTPAMQLGERQVCQWGRKSTLKLKLQLELWRIRVENATLN